MSAIQTKVEGIINDNAVAVFSKSWCPHCAAAKSLLSSFDAKFYTIELDQVDDGSAIQDYLKTKDLPTVPQIFIGGKSIGGDSDLKAKNAAGELKPLLLEVNAIEA